MNVAVIDTGTNSTRLLVADYSGGRLVQLYRKTQVTRLGEDVDRSGRLNQQAKDRVTACLADYASVIAGMEVSKTMVIATSSVREADDGPQFLESVAESHGFDWKLLTGIEEASLSFSGAASGFPEVGSILLFDVGGGSTEVVSGLDGKIVFSRSLKLGCVRLTERFVKTDPVSAEELRSIKTYVDSVLRREVEQIGASDPVTTLAVAGTATTLAAIDMGLESYDPQLVHGYYMSTGRLRELRKELSVMSLQRRLLIPTIESGRADVIVAGTLILERLLKHAGSKGMTVSELDILDGAALVFAQGNL